MEGPPRLSAWSSSAVRAWRRSCPRGRTTARRGRRRRSGQRVRTRRIASRGGRGPSCRRTWSSVNEAGCSAAPREEDRERRDDRADHRVVGDARKERAEVGYDDWWREDPQDKHQQDRAQGATDRHKPNRATEPQPGKGPGDEACTAEDDQEHESRCAEWATGEDVESNAANERPHQSGFAPDRDGRDHAEDQNEVGMGVADAEARRDRKLEHGHAQGHECWEKDPHRLPAEERHYLRYRAAVWLRQAPLCFT